MSSSSDGDDDVAETLPPEEHLSPHHLHHLRSNVQKSLKPAQQPLELDSNDDDKVPSTFPPRSVFNNPEFSLRKALVDSDEDFIKDQSSEEDDIPLSQIQKQAQSQRKNLPKQL